MLSLKTKKFLLDNKREIIETTSTIVEGLVVAGIASAGTILFNLHKSDMKIIVRDNPNEDFIIFEDMNWTNELRDRLHDPNGVIKTFILTKNDEKKDKKKDKKKNKKEGGIFNE